MAIADIVSLHVVVSDRHVPITSDEDVQQLRNGDVVLGVLAEDASNDDGLCRRLRSAWSVSEDASGPQEQKAPECTQDAPDEFVCSITVRELVDRRSNRT